MKEECGPELIDDDLFIYIGGSGSWLVDLFCRTVYYGGLAVVAYILFDTLGWL